jgi:hypothetical protein
MNGRTAMLQTKYRDAELKGGCACKASRSTGRSSEKISSDQLELLELERG